MLTREYVEELFSAAVLKKALELIKQKKIVHVVSNSSDYPTIRLTAIVKPEGHEVNVFYNCEKGVIEAKHCSCGGCKVKGGCVHAAALLYIIADALMDKRIAFNEPMIKSGPNVRHLFRRTNPEISTLAYDKSGDYVLWVEEFSADAFYEYMYISVNVSHGFSGAKYQVSNIKDFIACVKYHRPYLLTKGRTVLLGEESFNDVSRKLLDFLIGVEQDQPSIQVPEYMDMDSYNQSSAHLRVAGPFVDIFFNIVPEIRGLIVSRPDLCVRPYDHDITIEFFGAQDGALIKVYPHYVVRGTNTLYLFDLMSKPINVLVAPYNENLKELVHLSSDLYNTLDYIAEKDLKVFFSRMQDTIDKFVNIDAHNIEIEKYFMPIPSFEFRMDYEEKTILCQTIAVYGDERYNLGDMKDRFRKLGKRNIPHDKAMVTFCNVLFKGHDPEKQAWYYKGKSDEVFGFLDERLEELRSRGTLFISDDLKHIIPRHTKRLGVKISYRSGLIDLSIDTEEDEETLREILSQYKINKKYYKMQDGSFIKAGKPLDDLISLVLDLGLRPDDLADMEIEVPRYRMSLINHFIEQSSNLYIESDERYGELVKKFQEPDEEAHVIPEEIDGILREYQREGVKWLNHLCDNHFGALLADEMGLGKTVQVIAFLASRKGSGRTLIVCPASLIYNWHHEIKRFAPNLNPVMVVGNFDVRKRIIESSKEDDVLITSYDLQKRDIEIYEKLSFFCEVVDEAQFIKNANTQASVGVKAMRSTFRIALTGTPIENRLGELWSIFDYILPGYLYTYRRFKNSFEAIISHKVETKEEDDAKNEAMEKLRMLISPFVLRRAKANVLNDLPEKMEKVYYAPLEAEQRKEYLARALELKKMVTASTDESFSANRFDILASLMRLRQICCSPVLASDMYEGNSAKEDMCIDLIRYAIDEGHKVLLFSQFTSMLDILCKRLDGEMIDHFLLTGETPKEERLEMVSRFQEEDVPVFCISTKAGGTGLNLTAADIVILYDPWWNTAVENQATDRAHRIGQTHKVTVYRLIVQDTIEEKIIALQKNKQDLAETVLGGSEMANASLTREQMLEILG